ncbi:MAG: recombination protein RecT [Clostridiales bacterium]|jgi:recombination protein RecT|nr:recombination protein RecT [Clostridiales bacterium]
MSNQLAIIKKDTVDVVAEKIKKLQNSKEIHFPDNYSPDNALKSAWLILQETQDRNGKPALEVCTKDSIANALLDTVIQGLSPAKKQVYYVVYGNKLQAMRSYFGTIAVTKKLKGVEDIFAQVIYEGDEFEFSIEKGVKKVVKHKQTLDSIDNNKIVGAYATIIKDGKEYTEIMSKKQIDMSWSKSKMKDNKVQKEFPEEMAKRTVINRLCKWFANVSDDSDLLIESYNRTTQGEYQREDEVKEEIKANANKETLDFDASNAVDAEIIEDEPSNKELDSEPEF